MPHTEGAKASSNNGTPQFEGVVNHEQLKQLQEMLTSIDLEKFREFLQRQKDDSKNTPKTDGDESEYSERKKPVIHPNRVVQKEDGCWQTMPDFFESDSPTAQRDSASFGALYESRKKQYWMTSGEDDWIPANESAIKNHLNIERGVPAAKSPDGISPLNQAINFVTRYSNVEYATQLAGHSKGVYNFDGARILVNGAPTIIEPVKGKWPTIANLLAGMFGGEQLEYLYGWLKIAYQALTSGNFVPGQALVLAGPQDCGKTFIQNKIITPILGGRYAKPYQYMVGLTQFNSDLFMGEHLIIGDEMPATEYKERVAFGESIKNLLFDEKQRLHDKGKTAIMMSPFWRLSISVNDEPESLMILPPLRDSIRDKMMLFRVSRPNCLPNNAQEARARFAAAIKSELPAFVHFLANEHQIRHELVQGRCGIVEYCNPEIELLVGELSTEAAVMSLIEQELFPGITSGDSFEGTAGEISSRLKGSSSSVKGEAEKLFRNSIILGKILSSLEKDKGEYKGLITSEKTSRGRLFSINKRYHNHDRE